MGHYRPFATRLFIRVFPLFQIEMFLAVPRSKAKTNLSEKHVTYAKAKVALWSTVSTKMSAGQTSTQTT